MVSLGVTTENTEYTKFHEKKHRIPPLRGLRNTQKESEYWNLAAVSACGDVVFREVFALVLFGVTTENTDRKHFHTCFPLPYSFRAVCVFRGYSKQNPRKKPPKNLHRITQNLD
ncbi:MAG: hypothetical protein O0X93_06640 [Methanocorpusculum sp.]|nr:hypothetical protein [Methanocorpusculum sp.]MDE2522824.1 hypothetical protein [Methanocorpusculum sp.]MDE2525284.1 hypothetical protein [Methanocorpusculum sp.]